MRARWATGRATSARRRASRERGLRAIATRLERLDWAAFEAALDEQGYARTPAVLTEEECAALVALYARRAAIPEPRRHGALPVRRRRVQVLRGAAARARGRAPHRVLSAAGRDRLALGGRRWAAATRYPDELAALPPDLRRSTARRNRRRCSCVTQAGGYNCLHQDLYGAVAFPLQMTWALSRRGVDFDGGENLLVEQRPRAQSRGEVIALEQGEALIFPTRYRPVRGASGVSSRGDAARRQPRAPRGALHARRHLPRRRIVLSARRVRALTRRPVSGTGLAEALGVHQRTRIARLRSVDGSRSGPAIHALATCDARTTCRCNFSTISEEHISWTNDR